jgi:pyrimidine operon attenuation protein/uracil phosphoribosyltransferase
MERSEEIAKQVRSYTASNDELNRALSRMQTKVATLEQNAKESEIKFVQIAGKDQKVSQELRKTIERLSDTDAKLMKRSDEIATQVQSCTDSNAELNRVYSRMQKKIVVLEEDFQSSRLVRRVESRFQESKRTFQVVAVVPSGRGYMINVSGEDLVEVLKQKIFEKEGTPVDVQRLVFSGRNLANGYTMDYYGIKEMCRIEVLCSFPRQQNARGWF